MKKLYFIFVLSFFAVTGFSQGSTSATAILLTPGDVLPQVTGNMTVQACLLYTSDAADE